MTTEDQSQKTEPQWRKSNKRLARLRTAASREAFEQTLSDTSQRGCECPAQALYDHYVTLFQATMSDIGHARAEPMTLTAWGRRMTENGERKRHTSKGIFYLNRGLPWQKSNQRLATDESRAFDQTREDTSQRGFQAPAQALYDHYAGLVRASGSEPLTLTAWGRRMAENGERKRRTEKGIFYLDHRLKGM